MPFPWMHEVSPLVSRGQPLVLRAMSFGHVTVQFDLTVVATQNMTGAAPLKEPPSLKADVWLHFGFKNYQGRRAGQKQSHM